MNANLHLWLIPLMPFAGFLLNGILGRRMPKWAVTTVALLAALAAFCVVYGVFARQIPLNNFILPSLKHHVVFSGAWSPDVATVLILLGILIGVVIYLLGRPKGARVTAPFVGGEVLKEHPEMRMSGTEFYRTIQDMRGLKGIYALAQKKVFDIYEMGLKGAQGLYGVLRYFHNGILPTYLAWCLLGMLALFYFLLK